jgi:glycosyltransferase involved in cell wall biosynthesis
MATMYNSRKIAVVVPAYNEEAFITRVIVDMPDFVDHIVVVDDGSQDATSERATATKDPRLVIIRTPRNLGVGGAMQAGYRKALEVGAEVIAKMDGDGQMAPAFLYSLLDPLIEGRCDYAKGNRFRHARSLRAMPRVRVMGNMAMTFMTKLASGYWHVFDPQNGYTAIRAECLRQLDLDAIHRGYFFENDMLMQLNLHGFHVKDVPIPAQYGDEKSGLNIIKTGLIFPVLSMRRFISRVYQKYVLRDFSPIALFLFLGLILFGWGTAFGAYIWIRSNVTGHATPTGTIMLAVIPLILGFQLLLQAIVLDIQESKG